SIVSAIFGENRRSIKSIGRCHSKSSTFGPPTSFSSNLPLRGPTPGKTVSARNSGSSAKGRPAIFLDPCDSCAWLFMNGLSCHYQACEIKGGFAHDPLLCRRLRRPDLAHHCPCRWPHGSLGFAALRHDRFPGPD